MTPTHHLPDDVLAAYAAGSMSEGVALWVATHLALCPSSREQVAQAEAGQGHRVAVLNMANDTKPGGGWLGGAGAQERRIW